MREKKKEGKKENNKHCGIVSFDLMWTFLYSSHET